MIAHTSHGRPSFVPRVDLHRASGLTLVMLAAVLWATVGVASELVPVDQALPQDVYGFVRTLVAGPVILLIAFAAGGRKSIAPRRGSGASFAVFGLCCAVFQLCLFRSFEHLGVTITVFLTVCLPPVIALGWAAARRSEAVSAQLLLAFTLAAGGLLVFVSEDLAGGSGSSTLLGLGLSAAASVAFVVMTAAGRSLAADHSPMLVAGWGLIAAAVVLFAVVAAGVPNVGEVLAAAAGSWQNASLLLYLGLGPTALAYICYCSGMARCSSAIPGLVASMIEPAVAALLALLLLNEALSVWQATGCGIMMLAMLTLARGASAAPPHR
ncbi:DMT family transporter [Aestuariivirga sp.]|uniref:DMT family transporter n=1 Tax=Aestuariivirga sp. TaxID=2650926 RepID=UPI00391DB43E